MISGGRGINFVYFGVFVFFFGRIMPNDSIKRNSKGVCFFISQEYTYLNLIER